MRAGYHQYCAIARTLDLVGQRWTLLVVRELAWRGAMPAASIARGLPDVPMNQLVDRLGMLEARGIVEARERDGARIYALTAAGEELCETLAALARFGLEQLAGEPEADEALLPHVVMRQLALRYEIAGAGRDSFSGRFELILRDPEAMWSVEPGLHAPANWALIAGAEGLRVAAGACLDADATLRMSAAACARLSAGCPPQPGEVAIEGDARLASELLLRLAPRDAAAASAA